MIRRLHQSVDIPADILMCSLMGSVGAYTFPWRLDGELAERASLCSASPPEKNALR